MTKPRNTLSVQVNVLPPSGAWQIIYHTKGLEVEAVHRGGVWDRIDWDDVKAVNMMGVIIRDDFERMTFRREALAASGSSGQLVAIVSEIHYADFITELRFELRIDQ